MPESPEAIYERPEDYDLEHVGDTADTDFFLSLLRRLKPCRVLELACGNGRVTVPLAELGAKQGFDVLGLELVPEMLEAAQQKRKQASTAAQERLRLLEGDMRTWHPPEGEALFDLIVTPCSSVCHLLKLEDQLVAWRCAYDNLVPGGRFCVDVTSADLGSYADSLRHPPREWMEIDLDTFDEATQTRLLRYKTTRYLAHEQRAHIRFIYDKFVGTAPPERSISDFQSYVYYPRELQLLFMHTGFTVETMYGDYNSRPLGPNSPQMIVCGVKPE